VLAIAAYHAIGLLLSGRSPMLALLTDQSVFLPVAAPAPVDGPHASAAPRIDRAAAGASRQSGRGHRQVSRRAARAARRA
jgi:hypothetical protein